MELEGESLERLTRFILFDPSGTDGDQQLVMGFIASLQDDSYRWRCDRDIAPEYGSEQHVVRLRDGLRLVLVLDYNGDPGVVQVASVLTDRDWAG